MNEKEITKSDLLDAREEIQNSLICILDGLNDSLIDKCCDAVVSGFIDLLNKIK